MFSKLKQYLETMSVEENIPACDCIVYHGHDIVFRHMVGYSDAEKKNPVSADDKYMIYSTTKPITMVAVMQLIEKGLLRLEDEVYRYIPEFEHMYVGDKPAEHKITVEHLMSMCGGLNYNKNVEGIQEVIRNNPNATLKEIVVGMAKEPLDFEPGTHFQYSFCHDVLGRIIEVVSGLSFGEYLKKYIFEPLEMHNTGFSIEDAIPNLSEQYMGNEFDERTPTGPTNSFRLTPCYESGGAGLVSTVSDYGKFVETMCNYGVSSNGVRIISKESIDMMRNRRVNETCHTDFRTFNSNLKGYTYALGVRTLIDKVESKSKGPLGEFGWNGAAGAYALIDVENQIGIFYAQAVLCKSMSLKIHPSIRDLVYEAILSTN